jgi:transglutaminase-like putative cysteine protease
MTAAHLTTGRRFDLRPGREEMVDAGLVVVLAAIALVGFRTSFSGWNFFAVGLVGSVLGVLIAHLANALRQPVIVLAVMTLATFFLLGGAVALRTAPEGDALPTWPTMQGLATLGVHGWKELLTTLPPADDRGPLLVLPYLLGIFAGSASFGLARRTRFSFAPVGALFLVLAVVILLGTQTPAAQSLQGGGFGLIGLGWAALRSRRLRPTARNGSGRVARIATTGVLLCVALAGSLVLGPALPGAGAHHRTVLRSYVHPPANVGQYPSPLAAFRKYTAWKKDTLFAKTLFTVSGLPARTPVRIATLDAYNGSVWAAANRPESTNLAPDTFLKVGSSIASPAPGTHRTMTVTIGAGYSDYWLPTAGAVSGVRFAGPRAADLTTNLRYNMATGTGVVPDRVQQGDRYTMRVVLSGDTDLKPSDQLLVVSDPSGGTAGFLSSYAQQWSGKSNSQTAAVQELAKYLLHNGKYTNGEAGFEYYLPGHSQFRLKQFATGVLPGAILVGDDEQYAAAYALMIEDLGTPARVVLGATPAADGVVRGNDVHAWVEVQLADRSWRTIQTGTFMNNTVPSKLQQPYQAPKTAQIVPPPVAGRPHSSLDDAAQDNSSASTKPTKKSPSLLSSIHLPAWVVATAKYLGGPVLLLVVLGLASIAAKAARRRIRRRSGSPLRQLTTGWRELVDHARDLGNPIPERRTTRREQGRSLDSLGIRGLANLADAHVFGPGMPSERDAAHYWTSVLRARKQMSGTVGRWRRLRAAVSLASWRPSRLLPDNPP